ncbi:uncharacterized protein [Gossypium hirsutum]|uniref:DUF4283 domain-containing protein n=1 Tax=Gossypium hirsutum TaxID=3635 RepID=A0A1U8PCD7_GOSHI|nr:uncharacterized protein LOC107957045 [Gossypium hirsutum]
MEDELATLNLMDEEEDAFSKDASVVDNEYKYCLVGLCLIDSTVHFLSLRNTMADLWYPIGGVFISDLGERIYLLCFFHDIDINRILSGTPWFFNNHLLILHKIQPGEDPILVPLSTSKFWIQIHDLPIGMMTKATAKQFGNFLGQFVEYDAPIPTMGIQKFMRIRGRLDVTMPLKRKKKILIGKERLVYARFQYEKLSLFCFIYNRLGHGESFCLLRTKIDPSRIIFGWDISLRAVEKHWNSSTTKWLREADGSIGKKRKRMVGGGNVRSAKVVEENTQDQSASSTG